jgi:hypothetical protein
MGFHTHSFMFDVFPVIFGIVFLLIASVIVFTAIKGIGQWNKNNNSPRLTVAATVVAKRTNVSQHHHGTDSMHHHTSTSYYVTFQVESGDRMELHVAGQEYGLLIEGDRGQLTFQGTRYLGFSRN